MFSPKLLSFLVALFLTVFFFSASAQSQSRTPNFDSLLQEAKSGDRNAFHSIQNYAKKGNRDAITAFTTLAEGGDVDAQNELGVMYSEAIGVKRSQKTAVFWFNRSAELGYSIGTCNVGLHYSKGWGVPKDKTLMMKYVFAAHLLDGFKCNPAEYIHYFRPSECQIKEGWEMAIAWLRAHPDFTGDFGEKPWLKDDGKYSITVEEKRPTIDLPPKTDCKPKLHKK